MARGVFSHFVVMDSGIFTCIAQGGFQIPYLSPHTTTLVRLLDFHDHVMINIYIFMS